MEFVDWGEGDGSDLLFHGFNLPGMEASGGLIHLQGGGSSDHIHVQLFLAGSSDHH